MKINIKAITKKAIKKLFPNRILNIIKKIEQMDSKFEQINQKFSQIDNKLLSITNLALETKKEIIHTRINTELNFTYLAGFSGRIAEREIVNSYHDAPQDHILRYKFFAQSIQKGDKVLDAACGVGYGSAYLNDYTEAHSIIGGDIDPNVVEFCKKIFGSPTFVWKKNAVSFQQLDIANNEAFADNSFDKICSFETLEHIPHDIVDKAFSNLYNWLKPSGICYCSVPNNDVYPFEKYKWSPYHFRHYTAQNFYEALQKAGFSKITLKYYTPQGEFLDEMTLECFGTILAICEK